MEISLIFVTSVLNNLTILLFINTKLIILFDIKKYKIKYNTYIYNVRITHISTSFANQAHFLVSRNNETIWQTSRTLQHETSASHCAQYIPILLYYTSAWPIPKNPFKIFQLHKPHQRQRHQQHCKASLPHSSANFHLRPPRNIPPPSLTQFQSHEYSRLSLTTNRTSSSSKNRPDK